jgi:DNA-binding protein HU-beta
MNKAQLVDAVAEAADISKASAARSVDATMQAITDGLKQGDTVSITGFGNFSVRERAARTARNPRTGESVDVAASRLPVFKAGKALKDAVN